MKPVKLGMYGKGRTSWIDFRDVITAFEPFETSGAFHGTPVPKGDGVYIHMGQMPTDERDNFRAVGPDITYVVYSYVTPIAWHVDGAGWFRTNAGHSNTTKKHMGKLCGIDFQG
ncbi:hypothetical protein SEA_COMRADE_260 [Streptomyces phage Comrade]|uniref:DUF8033 domain-containing protein n=3 Tax=Gilsonvirus comrade TaxID=2846395 RepID=A0A345MEG2_9CAUD|nr:hypothetical protein HWB84_gp018 [Streptomyces phage Comrade]AXH68943.1 hypothetical protein SEA_SPARKLEGODDESS_264 [Streptomyces phage SparkleGoddess]QQO39917.1 hypothetical protein SEA_BELFORT_265 [Streptomyces phage Belfort]QZE11830.1 hypothetical protein SEA_KARP_265 [Streptomyces phage Karp]UTN92486.1 hypothetical protein SEA_STIGMA_262 [Streptomyces phage Stigma]AXQ63491.1 hypothetical protein SEA_COMRADE_260 [Streptomyces phage Comrade]